MGILIVFLVLAALYLIFIARLQIQQLKQSVDTLVSAGECTRSALIQLHADQLENVNVYQTVTTHGERVHRVPSYEYVNSALCRKAENAISRWDNDVFLAVQQTTRATRLLRGPQ